MNGHEWPSYLIATNGAAYRKLSEGEIIHSRDVPFFAWQKSLSENWHEMSSAMAGTKVGDYNRAGQFVYYRPITDPLTIAMARALAAKQPDKSTG